MEKRNSSASADESVVSADFRYQRDTNAARSESITLQAPSITLPKGGGALKNIDEKFQVNGANGTLALSIPIPVTSGRGGFQPSLALAYNSGTGNGPFGLGWSLDAGFVQRKTDKKLPLYRDGEESDVFAVSGGEDLVPCLDKDNNWTISEKINNGYQIKLYRPRIEGSFSRIERITAPASTTFYWKVTTRDNVVTYYGMTDVCRIADPEDAKKIFEWLPELSYDDKGNCMVYAYKREDLQGVKNDIHERNRFNGLAKFINRYLKSIRYGNVQAFYPDYDQVDQLYRPVVAANTEFLFEVVFNYGEHADNQVADNGTWKPRADAFSDYRAGFERRTYRLCNSVMMFHHFTNREFGLADNDDRVAYLVKSLDFGYTSSSDDTPQKAEVTYLTSVQYTGYKREGNGYMKRSLPTMQFDYQRLTWSKTVQTVSAEDIMNAPVGINEGYQWIDLYNEGIPGILTEQAEAWYYKSNLGEASFSKAKVVTPKPAVAGLAQGVLQVQDLAADGTKQIVVNATGLSGYFELSDDEEWQKFTPFQNVPNIDLRDPNIRLIDLNGDGAADILMSGDQGFTWYASKGRAGYDCPELVAKSLDDEQGPALVFADGTQSIFLADMNGDGLTDIVRIRNGEVSYYPGLGYGKFGPRVTTHNGPVFDDIDQFNPAYLQLADISGTGTTDLLYVGKNRFSAWLNLSGNGWSDVCEIEHFLPVSQPGQVSVLDLLGNGTSCIVWSSPLPADATMPMRYIDLMGGKKPHIMNFQKNNFGKETHIEYRNSTHYYLADKKEGRHWVTKLPFPVQCVSKVEVVDTITDVRLTNKYSYHHGYFDHRDREFRGFGMVEQTDTEEYEYLKNLNAANAADIKFHGPPILTKTWFHLGAFLRDKKIFGHYEHEYWYHDPVIMQQTGSATDLEYRLSDAVFEDNLPTHELMEAHRACKGSMVRQEIFALDGTQKAKIPYSVVTHNCRIKRIQPAGKHDSGVFMVNESESVAFSYERTITDPRVAHTLNCSFDELGNVVKSATVAYPRRSRPAEITDGRIWDAQRVHSILVHETGFTNDVTSDRVYRLRLSHSSRKFEWRGLAPAGGRSFFTVSDFTIDPPAIGFEDAFTTNVLQKKLVERTQAIYLSDDVVTPLAYGQLGGLGLKYESYQAAFTTSLLDDIYKTGNAPSKVGTLIMGAAKYIDLNNDGIWWVRSGTAQYADGAGGEDVDDAARRFFSPLSYMSPTGALTKVSYYNDYFLMLQKTRDALDGEVTVEEYDFRALFPKKIKDINGNFSEVSIDALGLIVGTALSGKGNEGDELVGFTSDLSDEETADFFSDPFNTGRDLLAHASVRIIYDFSSLPCRTGTVVREEHHAMNPNAKLQYGFEYSDGLGNVAMRKIQAEPGDAPYRGGDGKFVRTGDGILAVRHADSRWVGDGRTIRNNKGKPVKQYEPYFSDNHLYEDEPDATETGVTMVLWHDPIGRVIKTDMPDDTFSTVEYGAWLQKEFDANDTVKQSRWYTDRMTGALDAEFNDESKDPIREKEAAEKAGIHDGSPTVFHSDILGRRFFIQRHNKQKDFSDNTTILEDSYSTYIQYDVEGNITAVTDARDNIVMRYKYDMLGSVVYQKSMDAGACWMLADVTGKPSFMWDSKDQKFETRYDELHRPLTVTVIASGAPKILERYVYANVKGTTPAQLASWQLMNVLGKATIHYDTAGISRLVRCDFHNNPLETSRELCSAYQVLPDWTNVGGVAMEGEVFVSKTRYDALNRVISILTPHTAQLPASTVRPGYNEANLLDKIDVALRGSQTFSSFVRNIDYDAKGQRMAVLYGNNTVTRYTYDRKTFRLTRLLTTRNSGADILQDLRYTYDAVGNVTHQKDRAQQTIYFNNHQVDPHADYVYDALYRLIQAKGRQHIANGQASDAYDFQRVRLAHKGNGTQVQEYTQRYTYDKAGNMGRMQNVNGWSRTLTYGGGSNRLLTSVANHESGTPFQFTYDEHGSMRAMSHLSQMDWDAKDHLQHVVISASNHNDFAVQAWYTYDSGGQRVRKVVEKNNAVEERIYLDGFEIFRKRQNGALTLQRETLHVTDGTKRIALVEHRSLGNDGGLQDLIRYQYGNHLGTSCLELDGDPNAPDIISYEEYYPFGTTSYQAVRNTQETAKRYRFTGKERDEESGLYYHGARYYAPWLARWTASDPAGIGDGVNTYSFVSNNPVVLHDPSGMAGQPGNNIDDLFLFLRNQAGFEVGANGIKYTGQTFGTAAHASVTTVLEDVKKIGFKDADRIFSEVAIKHDTLVITEIGGSPIKGHHNLDLVAMPEGQTIAKGNVMAKGSAEVVSDVKYGRGKITDAHSDFGKTATTANGKTTASSADEADAIFNKKQTPEELAKGAKQEAEAIEKSKAVQEFRKTKEAQKVAAKEITAEVVEKGSKTAAKAGKMARVGGKLAKAGRHLLAALPFAGIVAGQASAAHAASQGDYTGAILDEAGFIPVAGDLLDAARGGYALGEALDEGLGISEVATEYGTAAEALAKKAGLSGDAAMYVGATAAAISSITVAPSEALARTVSGWFE